jgi:hypothetical protein
MARISKRQQLNERIKALAEARGMRFKPWEWPRPWAVDWPEHPEDDVRTRQARKVREYLIAELERSDAAGRGPS